LWRVGSLSARRIPIERDHVDVANYPHDCLRVVAVEIEECFETALDSRNLALDR